MMGSVAVGVFLVESTGTALDWSDVEVNETLEGIYAGLDWWASEEPRARLSFSYELYIRSSTSYEPTHHSLNDDHLWIDEILTDLGYTDPDPWLKALRFNNDLRERLGTDWGFSLFVVDSDDAMNMGRFTNDQYAHAYFGGPWIAMSRFSSWAFNSLDYHRVVPAHEMGHIFYASDEYDSAPPMYSGYLNCPDNNGASGIMNRNTLRVSASTRCQIGWVDADENGVLDVINMPPETSLTPYAPDPTAETEIRYTGNASVVPSTNRNPIGPGNDVTISRITGVEVRVDGGPWTEALAQDGAFSDFEEAFEIPAHRISYVDPLPPYATQSAFTISATTPLEPGTHVTEARAHNTEESGDPSPAADILTTTAQTVSRVELWYLRADAPYAMYGADTEAPWSWSFDTMPLGGDGNYRFSTVAIDRNAGTEALPPNPDVNTTVDTKVPSLTLLEPGEEWLSVDSLDVRWSMADATSGIASAAVRLDAGGWMEIGNSTSHAFPTISEGVHTVRVRVLDRAGLAREVVVRPRVDRTAPVIAIVAPEPEAVVESRTVSVAWNGVDALSGIAGYEVRLDDGAWEQVGLQTSHAFQGVAPESHTLFLRASDAAGNVMEANMTFTARAPPLDVGVLVGSPFLWIAVGGAVAGLLFFILRRRGRKGQD